MGTVRTDPPPGYIYLQADLCTDLHQVWGQTDFNNIESFLTHLLDLHAKQDDGTRVVQVSQRLACRFTALQTAFDGSDELMKYLLHLFSRTSKYLDSTQAATNPPARKKSRKSQPKRNLKHNNNTFHDSEAEFGSPNQSQDGLDFAVESGEAGIDLTVEHRPENATKHVAAQHIEDAFNVLQNQPVNEEPVDSPHVPLLKMIKHEKDADPEGPLCLTLHQPRSTNEAHRAPQEHRLMHDSHLAPDTGVSTRGKPTSDTNFSSPPRHGLPQWRSSSEPLGTSRNGSEISPQKPLSLQVSPQRQICYRFPPKEQSPGSDMNVDYKEMDAENNNVIHVNTPYPVLGKIRNGNTVHEKKDNCNAGSDTDGYNYVLNSLTSPKLEVVTPRSAAPTSTLQIPLQYPEPSPYSRAETPVQIDEPEDLSFKSPDTDNVAENLTIPKQQQPVLNHVEKTADHLNQKHVNEFNPTQVAQLPPSLVNQHTPTQIKPPIIINGPQSLIKYDKNGNTLFPPVFRFPNGFPVNSGMIQNTATMPIHGSTLKHPTMALIGEPPVSMIPMPKYRPIAQKGTAVSGNTQVNLVANGQGNQSIVLASRLPVNNTVVNVPNTKSSVLSKPVAIAPAGMIPQTTASFQPPPQPVLVPPVSPAEPPSPVHILSPQSAPTPVNETLEEDESQLKRRRKRMDDTSVFRDPPESSLPFNGPHKYRFYCDVCDTGFTRRYTFNRHKCKGRVEKHYCQLCDKAYLSKYKLKDHVLVKHEGQTVSCPDCGKRFSSRSSMEMHKKQQHEGQFSIFCKVCGKGFNHTGHYYGHMNKHTNTKPFWCQQCGKRFYGSSYLHNHKQVCRSNADFNYACDQCDRKFKCELYLKKHRKVHEATPIIYQAQGGMQVESDEDEDVDIMDIMQVCKGKADMGDDNLVINESDEEDMLVIDSSATSPESATNQLPLDGDLDHRNNTVLNEDNLPAALTSVARLSQESITAS